MPDPVNRPAKEPGSVVTFLSATESPMRTNLLLSLLTVCFLSATSLRAADPPAPTKEMAVRHLQAFLAVLDSRDFDKALTFVAPMQNATPEEQKKVMQRLAEAREITKQGIEVLAAKGQWGKLTQVRPDNAEKWAKKFQVPPEQCYALSYEGAEAAFHFDGKSLKIIRCDDIGKLKR
jgi:hypothetical protein